MALGLTPATFRASAPPDNDSLQPSGVLALNQPEQSRFLRPSDFLTQRVTRQYCALRATCALIIHRAGGMIIRIPGPLCAVGD
jgi:hypothetical protein